MGRDEVKDIVVIILCILFLLYISQFRKETEKQAKGRRAARQAIAAGAIKVSGKRETMTPGRGARQEAAKAPVQAHTGSLTMIRRIMMILKSMRMMPGAMILTAGMKRMITGKITDDDAFDNLQQGS